jgi:transcriptional regulator with PAS, ATPase and Fis domain
MSTVCVEHPRAAQFQAVSDPGRSERPAQRLPGFQDFVGASQPVCRVFELTERAAVTGSTVLIRGESGVGKELIAQAIHENSTRRHKPLVVVNITAVPGTLLESELFGHVKGAYTDASSNRVGLFEAADGGTLFLDEIGDLELACQAKLLRVLEDHKVTPVGGGRARRVDVRVVTATRHNLERMVRQGTFREDLYYRLNVVTIRIPPLRQRPGDIQLLVEHFLQEMCHRNGKPLLEIDDQLMDYLRSYEWPGNVRQLRNCVESMVVLSDSNTLTMDDLPPTARSNSLVSEPEIVFPTNKTLDETQKLVVLERLDRHDGNRSRAARSLGISVRTLQRKLKKWGLQTEPVAC